MGFLLNFNRIFLFPYLSKTSLQGLSHCVTPSFHRPGMDWSPFVHLIWIISNIQRKCPKITKTQSAVSDREWTTAGVGPILTSPGGNKIWFYFNFQLELGRLRKTPGIPLYLNKGPLTRESDALPLNYLVPPSSKMKMTKS